MSLNGRRREPLTALHCRSSSGRFGPERTITELVPALHELAVQTRLLALYRPGPGAPACHPWIEEARAAGLDAEQIIDPGPLSIGVVRRLARRIHNSGADILHTHDYRTNILGGIVARRPDRFMPWVATVHLHTVGTRRLRLYRALDLFLLRLADRVITVSRDQRRMLLRRGVDRRRLVLIPTVIDAEAFAANAAEPGDARAALGLPAGVPVITLVGRLAEQKGVDSLLSAARVVSNVRRDARFLVVGSGALRAELEAQSRALGLNGVVSFLGYRPNVAAVLSASDVLVLPSRAEGLPVVLLEAMAMERPVVASRVGGVPDLVHHLETGLLIAPDAPAELAEGVLRLLADPDLAERLAVAGRRRVVTHHSPQRAARRLAAVYRAVLAERA